MLRVMHWQVGFNEQKTFEFLRVVSILLSAAAIFSMYGRGADYAEPKKAVRVFKNSTSTFQNLSYELEASALKHHRNRDRELMVRRDARLQSIEFRISNFIEQLASFAFIVRNQQIADTKRN